MASEDPNFLGKLKTAWDLYFKQNPHLVLALCGSISVWIEENILSSTGFLGRESLTLTLQEMQLSDCNEFWGREKNRTSAADKLKLLSVIGGIPRYLENIQPKRSAEENIEHLCFTESGILFREFEKIFSDLYHSRGKFYRQVIELLVDSKHDQKTLMQRLNTRSNGEFSRCLENLWLKADLSRAITPGNSKTARFLI